MLDHKDYSTGSRANLASSCLTHACIHSGKKSQLKADVDLLSPGSIFIEFMIEMHFSYRRPCQRHISTNGFPGHLDCKHVSRMLWRGLLQGTQDELDARLDYERLSKTSSGCASVAKGELERSAHARQRLVS